MTANPRAVDTETVLERVLFAAAQEREPIHHVTVQQIDGAKSVSFDIELDGRMSLGAAHEIASRLEKAVRAELGPLIEVDTHIEPLEVRELSGRDVGPSLTGEIAAALARHAAESGIITEIHDVRARQTPAGLVVNYHCRVDPVLSVDEVHSGVNALDHEVRADFTAITRIVGHAEPRPADVHRPRRSAVSSVLPVSTRCEDITAANRGPRRPRFVGRRRLRRSLHGALHFGELRRPQSAAPAVAGSRLVLLSAWWEAVAAFFRRTRKGFSTPPAAAGAAATRMWGCPPPRDGERRLLDLIESRVDEFGRERNAARRRLVGGTFFPCRPGSPRCRTFPGLRPRRRCGLRFGNERRQWFGLG